MIKQTYNDIVAPELLRGAIENNEFHGFKQDYHVIHCLLKIYKPKTLFEVGTNLGRGTMIMKNALGNDSQVFSLDLPTKLAHISLQHPINEGHGDKVGSLCKLPFTQLRGDSMTFDFSQYPCEGYYIDGEHTQKAVEHETKQVLKLSPKIVIYHDTDLIEVMQGILNGLDASPNANEYTLYRVSDTRISYLLKNA